jgi:hypothetical protein
MSYARPKLLGSFDLATLLTTAAANFGSCWTITS